MTDFSTVPLVYTSADLRRELRISSATLHRLKAAGKLPRAFRLGGKLRWNAAEVREWAAAGMPDQKNWEAMRKAGKR